ncbi:MAG: hydroxymethylglutaryl-CoA lyase [Pseudohongiellaceae bacterium]
MIESPERVRIVEVGPRDGLQNESGQLSVEDRIAFIERLADAGIRHIEAGSFVSPRWVPSMAGSDQVITGIRRRQDVRYTALTPNLTGLQRAMDAGVREVAVFAAASEAFSQKNINCSIDESMQRFAAVCEAAQQAGVAVRGYVSCAMGCPWQGDVPAREVARVTGLLMDIGCYEVSVGDTIGVGTPRQVQQVLECCMERTDASQLAVHFHDTYGQALANILAALQLGIATVDSSVAGLGGCPYARGASGNVSTEDVIYMLHGMGIETGVDLPALVRTGQWISAQLQRPVQSRVSVATASHSEDGEDP